MRHRSRRNRFSSRKSRALRGVPASHTNLDDATRRRPGESLYHPMREGIVFRPRLAFRLPVIFALVFWMSTGVSLLLLDLVSSVVIPHQTYATVALFILFFLMVVFHYHHFAIQVDLTGVAVVGAASFKAFLWSEIIEVEGGNSFFPGAQVYTRTGDAFGFSGLVFQEHDRLLELIALYSRAD